MTPYSFPAPGRRVATVRSVLVALFALLLTLTAAGPVEAGTATRTANQFLIAADPSADAIYVYRTTNLKRTGQLDGVELSSHAGTIQLSDGRLIFVDDRSGEVKAVRVTNNGRPKITGTVRIPGGEWAGATWAATDTRQRYYAVSGGEEGPTQSVTVVDLRTFVAHQIQITVAPDTSGELAETQVYLAGKPLQLVVTTGGKFQTFPMSDIVAGRTPAATSTAPVRAGTHGPVVSRDGGYVFSTTVDGFDGATISGATLGSVRSVDYSTTRNVVQNYRPRMASDARTVWGTAAEDTALAPADWADTRNNVNIIDTTTFRSALVRLPDGVASRLALSARYGAVSTVHPDGDVLTLLDTKRGSPTYRRVVGTVALPASSGGPVAGTPPSGTQGHAVTLSSDGALGFVSNGGDALISVIDTKNRRVSGTITTPTALSGGGYLTVVKARTPLHDLIAR